MPFADNYTCIDSDTRNNLVGIIEQRINQIQEELLHIDKYYQWELGMKVSLNEKIISLKALHLFIEAAKVCD